MDTSLSLVLSNPFTSKTLLKSRSLCLNRFSKGNAIRRSSSLNFNGVFSNVDALSVRGLAKNSGVEGSREEERKRKNSKLHCITSKNNFFLGRQGMDQDHFSNSRFDLLDPIMLGISLEFPDRPDEETASWAMIEQKAKSLDIPISLRMIKKKLQWEKGFADSGSDSGYCPVKASFASMVFIIVELQSCVLHMREEMCHQDLEVMTRKVQKEMHLSFVWLFQQVFSRTPALMLHVMIILASFGVHLASHSSALVDTSLNTELIQAQKSSENPRTYQNDELVNLEEMDLWKSMVDDATKMEEVVDVDNVEVLDHKTMQPFVSPWPVEFEPGTSEDYHRTNRMYQMNLSQEPENPLLLCNYAQFLYLVAQDYDRAEEYFKRALQVFPPDAESVVQYANFLWAVKKDYEAAEERFMEALALEPGNSYFAYRYVQFLKDTGGKETCFILNNCQNPNE